MHIDIVTIFPEMVQAVLQESILKRAQAAGRAQLDVHNLRRWTTDRRGTVDDRPYGGGPGMVMKPEPMFKAVKAIEAACHPKARGRGAKARGRCEIILTSPQGQPLTQRLAKQLATRSHLILLCGHYEGVDERVREALADREVSIGDYVLTGGELPALVIVDAVVRLLPGVLGHREATKEESFVGGLLEYPQYTRPLAFRGMEVPDILRSGNHQQVAAWRQQQALTRTLRNRPDLLHNSRHVARRRTRASGGTPA